MTNCVSSAVDGDVVQTASAVAIPKTSRGTFFKDALTAGCLECIELKLSILVIT